MDSFFKSSQLKQKVKESIRIDQSLDDQYKNAGTPKPHTHISSIRSPKRLLKRISPNNPSRKEERDYEKATLTPWAEEDDLLREEQIHFCGQIPLEPVNSNNQANSSQKIQISQQNRTNRLSEAIVLEQSIPIYSKKFHQFFKEQSRAKIKVKKSDETSSNYFSKEKLNQKQSNQFQIIVSSEQEKCNIQEEYAQNIIQIPENLEQRFNLNNNNDFQNCQILNQNETNQITEKQQALNFAQTRRINSQEPDFILLSNSFPKQNTLNSQLNRNTIQGFSSIFSSHIPPIKEKQMTSEVQNRILKPIKLHNKDESLRVVVVSFKKRSNKDEIEFSKTQQIQNKQRASSIVNIAEQFQKSGKACIHSKRGRMTSPKGGNYVNTEEKCVDNQKQNFHLSPYYYNQFDRLEQKETIQNNSQTSQRISSPDQKIYSSKVSPSRNQSLNNSVAMFLERKKSMGYFESSKETQKERNLRSGSSHASNLTFEQMKLIKISQNEQNLQIHNFKIGQIKMMNNLVSLQRSSSIQ